MDSVQYEELCRHFIAAKFALSLDDVKSVRIRNPRRPKLPAFEHQIDLYWETGNEISLYLNIANAKWRGSEKVDQGEVLLLDKVRQEVGAHKAFMISSVGFSAGAKAAAKHHGIALHTVAPAFDVSALPSGDRAAVRAALHSMASSSSQPIFNHSIEHRLDLTGGPSGQIPSGWPPTVPHVEHHTRVVHQPEGRVQTHNVEIRGVPNLRGSEHGGRPERTG